MKEIIHVEDGRGRLHCDNEACQHELAEGEVTWGEHLIGYPCPKCDASMLTRRDFDASEKVMRYVKWVNKWFGWLGWDYSKADPKTVHSLSVRHHDGQAVIKREE